jgi:hypothetical protein
MLLFRSTVNRLKEETGVVINITDGDGSNIIRIEGKYAGVAAAKKVSFATDLSEIIFL